MIEVKLDAKVVFHPRMKDGELTINHVSIECEELAKILGTAHTMCGGTTWGAFIPLKDYMQPRALKFIREKLNE